MKILLMSDSHMLSGMQEIITFEKADLVLHLGDSQFLQNNSEMQNIDYKVRGNCDFEHYPEEEHIKIDNKKWLLMHGHQVYNANNLYDVAYYAEAQGADVVCYGHTHIAVFEQIGNVLVVNPGSFARSRSSLPNSYMTIDTDTYQAKLINAKTKQVITEMGINE